MNLLKILQGRRNEIYRNTHRIYGKNMIKQQISFFISIRFYFYNFVRKSTHGDFVRFFDPVLVGHILFPRF